MEKHLKRGKGKTSLPGGEKSGSFGISKRTT